MNMVKSLQINIVHLISIAREAVSHSHGFVAWILYEYDKVFADECRLSDFIAREGEMNNVVRIDCWSVVW